MPDMGRRNSIAVVGFGLAEADVYVDLMRERKRSVR